jgi:hypothetical protein
MNRLIRRALVGSLAVALTVATTGAANGIAQAAPASPQTPTPAPTGRLRPPGAGPVATPNVLGAGNLVNHGGSVQSSSTNYLIFWGIPAAPTGFSCPTCDSLSANPSYDDANPYAAAIERFFATVGGTSFYGMLTQYGVTNSSHLGGVYSDLTTPAAGTITSTAIEAEVRRVQAATGWAGGITHNFFVITGPGAVPCAPDGACAYTDFCGYHWTMSDRNGVATAYQVIPYPGPTCSMAVTGAVADPNLVPGADDAISVISHELFESVTDPGIGFGDYGWYDDSGYEIGDKCAWIFGSSTPTGGNVTLGGHPFMVQQEYSNAGSYCRV